MLKRNICRLFHERKAHRREDAGGGLPAMGGNGYTLKWPTTCKVNGSLHTNASLLAGAKFQIETLPAIVTINRAMMAVHDLPHSPKALHGLVLLELSAWQIPERSIQAPSERAHASLGRVLP